jgi:hypothetical protein
MMEIIARDKHTSLLGPFVSYEENEVLNTTPRDTFARLHILHSI